MLYIHSRVEHLSKRNGIVSRLNDSVETYFDEGFMKRMRRILAILSLLVVTAVFAQSQGKKVKTVFVIILENHNWTGDDAGASFGAPALKDSPLPRYINGTLMKTSAHAEQYFNPPGNHPS